MMRRIIVAGLIAGVTMLAASCCLGQCGPFGCPGGQCHDDQGVRQSPAPRNPKIPKSPNSAHYASVVRIKTVDHDGANSFGSGVAVLWGNRLAILTAGHVVGDARAVFVQGHTRYHRAGVLRQDRRWDVAVLATRTADDFTPVRLAWRATGHPAPGETLYSCGLGGDGRLAVNRGRFGRYVGAGGAAGPTDWMVLSGTARQGDSGGPVFNTRGELVGVLWGTDGRRVVAAQCGRLHMILRETLGEVTKSEVRTVESETKRVKGGLGASRREATSCASSFCATRLVPICRPRQPEPERAPRVIVQSDPTISHKLDRLIENTQPPIEEEPPKSEPNTNPLVMLLVIGGAVAVGFVVYFASQKGD